MTSVKVAGLVTLTSPDELFVGTVGTHHACVCHGLTIFRRYIVEAPLEPRQFFPNPACKPSLRPVHLYVLHTTAGYHIDNGNSFRNQSLPFPPQSQSAVDQHLCYLCIQQPNKR